VLTNILEKEYHHYHYSTEFIFTPSVVIDKEETELVVEENKEEQKVAENISEPNKPI
jgi:hypothetical protein